MPSSPDVLVATRHHQMFPVLEASEIGRIARLGERRTYAAGSDIFTTGEVAVGAFVLLSGRVDITQRNRYTEPELIVTHGPGSFMGELAQLSGRPSLVDGVAREPVEALVIPPSRLRDLLVEEAERRRLCRRQVGTFHASPRVWQPLRQVPSERTMAVEQQNRSLRQGERMSWTSDCRASMRS
jgi:CRP-like cAMP-binding protein